MTRALRPAADADPPALQIPAGASVPGPKSELPATSSSAERSPIGLPADLAAVSEAELLATLSGDSSAAGATSGPCRSRGLGGRRSAGSRLPWLSRASPSELCAQAGWSPEGAARVWAAFELGRRAERARLPVGTPIAGAAAAAALLSPLLRGRRQECLALGLLDARHRVLSAILVGEGTLDRSLVHPREVFAPALREGAAAVLCAHNHPSGDPEPSAQDWAVTRRLRSAGELLGVPLLDHLVISPGCWVSLRARDPVGLFAASGGAQPDPEGPPDPERPPGSGGPSEAKGGWGSPPPGPPQES